MKKFFSICLFVVCLFALTTTNIASNSTSKVTFSFDGLGVLAFGDSTKASLGILDVIHHTPNIEIKTIENGKQKAVQIISANRLKNVTLTVSLPNNSLQPSRHYSTDMSKDKTDFRWCLDMESDLFQKQLYLKQDKLTTKIHFTTGNFYTASLSPDKYQFTANSTIHSFNRQIGTPGASVQLQQGDVLNIAGLAQDIALPYRASTSYEIAITNLPPKDMMSMDHFLFYYDALKEPVTKFMPVQVKKAAYYPYPLVCDFIVLGKSKVD